jgi:hypothetical protein
VHGYTPLLAKAAGHRPQIDMLRLGIPIIWVIGNTAMFLWLGHDWLMIWWMPNLPLSIILKPLLWEKSIELYFYVVTLGNACIFWGIWEFAVLVRNWIREKN